MSNFYNLQPPDVRRSAQEPKAEYVIVDQLSGTVSDIFFSKHEAEAALKQCDQTAHKIIPNSRHRSERTSVMTYVLSSFLKERVEMMRAEYPAASAKAGKRLERAAELVDLGYVKPTDDPSVFRVRSQSDPIHYTVNVEEKTCTCPDDYGGACKHRIAVFFYREIYIRTTGQILSDSRKRLNKTQDDYFKFLEAHEAPNIKLADFMTHPHYGTVDYVHPAVGINKIEVLATKRFYYPVFRCEVVEVVSLRDLPFLDGEYPHYYATLPAYVFTPAGQEQPYEPAVNVEEIQHRAEYDRHERRPSR